MSTRSPSKPVARARGTVAALTRSRQPDDEILLAARGELKALTLGEYIQKVVSAAPPLTAEQRDSLTALLHTSGGEHE